jgi:hypothetical protein
MSKRAKEDRERYTARRRLSRAEVTQGRRPRHGRRRAFALVLTMAAMAGCKETPPPPPQAPVKLSAEQKARIDELIAQAKKGAQAQDEERREFAAKSPPPLAPDPELGACEVTAKSLVPEDPETADTNSGKRRLAAKRSTRVILLTDVFKDGKAEGSDGPATRATSSLADDERRTLTERTFTASPQIDEAVAKLEKTLKATEDGYDVTFVVDKLVQPVARGKDEFDSGVVVGMVYLWSRAKHAIVCAADVASINSRVVKVYGHEDDKWLQQNLIEAAVLDALSRLVRVGPSSARAASSASAGGPKPPP